MGGSENTWAGYGRSFYHWLFKEEINPYQSWGNGGAMWVSPIGFGYDTEVEVLREARATAVVSE